MKLYDYAAEFAELFDSLGDMAGDDDLEQAWFDTLESIEAEFEDKAENVAAYIKQLKGEADMLREQERAFAERRRAKEHHAERLKKYLLDNMAAVNLKKIDRPLAMISVKNNAESPRFDNESGFIEWAKRNADELLRYKEPEIDKNAVKRYLQEGHELDGVRLERSQSIIIK